ncbi:carbonic anhydrase [Pelagicoccus sp. SDUM812002]|uniref:carbonic anhydrase n=1 Tax=Pelagicoccus sp. SDUM812002 TaxID=3041266 RepID=UPI0028100ED7|nr:carbonic anhydrase [Pelagicoccus sp. SDUM812002]MDQ8186938.1 carbonic anhydrase [Pelagicoccus sp. SDUM812002]
MPDHNDSNDLPDSLREGHMRFLQNDYANNRELYAHLADGQSPKVMWIGCADSRVPAERILGAELGDLFLLRNVANIVPPLAADEASVGSALHFAVDQLKVSHVVICGHSDCGGMKALLQLGKVPMDRMLSSWVEYAIPALEDCEVQSLEGVAKANVISQSEHLLEYPCVKDAVAEGRLAIHACYYEIGIGRLEQYDAVSKTWNYMV